MEQHIYEDPDAMMPTVCDTVVSTDYREHLVMSRVSSGNKSGLSQQKLGNKQQEKSSKKWNIKLGKKSSGISNKKGENKGAIEGNSFKSANSDSCLKKGKSRSLPHGQTLKIRGNSLPEVVEHFYKVADEHSPPPVLPSRGYLLDEEFAAELNSLEKEVADTNIELEEEEEEDDEYTPMGVVQFPNYENFVDTNRHQDDEALMSSHTPPIPERHYKNFIDPACTVAMMSDDKTTPQIPERQRYENFTDGGKKHRTNQVPLRDRAKDESHVPPIPPKDFTGTQKLPARDTSKWSQQEQEDESYVPPIPERHYEVDEEEDRYINQDDIPTGASRAVVNLQDSEGGIEYDYVLSESLRCARRMGRWAGRIGKK